MNLQVWELLVLTFLMETVVALEFLELVMWGKMEKLNLQDQQ
jgi:hypothetical protein